MTSYVVHLVGTENPHPFRHFAHRVDAAAFAASAVQSGAADRAKIYSVAEAEPRAAIEAVKTGAAELVDIKSPRATDADILAAEQEALTTARKQGMHAVLKLMGIMPKQ